MELNLKFNKLIALEQFGPSLKCPNQIVCMCEHMGEQVVEVPVAVQSHDDRRSSIWQTARSRRGSKTKTGR